MPDLEPILRDFYNRVFEDTMIGYLFRGRNKERLIEKELELVKKILGEPVEYTGRPMDEVHLPLKLRAGHFHRRNQIFLEVLQDHQFPEVETKILMDHHARLQSQILAQNSSPSCE